MISKEIIGLAGEYAVASELCRRGAYCQLTLGNRKKTDLIIDLDDSIYRVSVKSKSGNEWPAVKGISKELDLIILVDFQNKSENERPDFYIISLEDWKKFIKNKMKNYSYVCSTDSENSIVHPTSTGKGRIGCNISISDVKKFKEKWPEF